MSEPFEDDLVYIDRCAFVVRPTWKFAEWLNQFDEPIADENQVFIQTVYLVDFHEQLDLATTADLLDQYFIEIAASEFAAWWTDEQDWPQIRNLQDFFEYFECSPSETVIDLAVDDEFPDGDFSDDVPF